MFCERTAVARIYSMCNIERKTKIPNRVECGPVAARATARRGARRTARRGERSRRRRGRERGGRGGGRSDLYIMAVVILVPPTRPHPSTVERRRRGKWLQELLPKCPSKEPNGRPGMASRDIRSRCLTLQVAHRPSRFPPPPRRVSSPSRQRSNPSPPTPPRHSSPRAPTIHTRR